MLSLSRLVYNVHEIEYLSRCSPTFTPAQHAVYMYLIKHVVHEQPFTYYVYFAFNCEFCPPLLLIVCHLTVLICCTGHRGYCSPAEEAGGHSKGHGGHVCYSFSHSA